MIHIHFSFLVVALVFIAMGQPAQFFLLFLSLTLHELTHVYVAKRFGGQLGGFNITALGECAILRRMEYLTVWQRILILLAGPGCNALLAALLYLAQGFLPNAWAANIELAVLYNIALCVFNLLPVFPLDGGRLAQILLGNWFGVLRANRWIASLGRVVGLLLIVPGCVQVILYPYNISLICMGVYIWKRNRRIILQLTYEFLQAMQAKSAWLQKHGLSKIRLFCARADQPLKTIMERLCWDSMTVVTIGEALDVLLKEQDIMAYVMQRGLSGTLEDVKNFQLDEPPNFR